MIIREKFLDLLFMGQGHASGQKIGWRGWLDAFHDCYGLLS